VLEPFPLPDLSTKEKAQRYVGLDMVKAYQEKARFLKEVVPSWDEKAKARQAGY
jgi:nitrite reductase (cytochrome c-552)